MVSGGQIGSVASDVSSAFSSLKGYISDLQGAWEGTSYDNLISQIDEFTGEFESVVSTQLQSFQEAVNLYSQYKTAKNNYQISESNYNMAVANEDGEYVNRYTIDMQKYKAQMETLKSQITAALQNASSPQLEATSISGTKGEFVNFYQTDYGDVAYGYYDSNGNYQNFYRKNGNIATISSHGCGPTSLSMVFTYLLGEEMTPVEATQIAEAGNYTTSNGTKHSYFAEVAEEYGLECTRKDGASAQDIQESLSNDKTLILLMGPGHFTSGGHYIVIRGLDENGEAIVADPASSKRTEQTWDLNLLANESSIMWSFDN